MDGGDGKKIVSNCKYVPSFTALINIEAEKYHKFSEAYHKIN